VFFRDREFGVTGSDEEAGHAVYRFLCGGEANTLQAARGRGNRQAAVTNGQK
jgi:hypothetical protein